MEIDGITVSKIAAELQERGSEISTDGELMSRGGRCLSALSDILADTLSGGERIGGESTDLKPGEVAMVEVERPPLGLRPCWLVASNRIDEIMKAMQRYTNADISVPSEWTVELGEQYLILDRSRENR